jgi:hypothetical protein
VGYNKNPRKVMVFIKSQWVDQGSFGKKLTSIRKRKRTMAFHGI